MAFLTTEGERLTWVPQGLVPVEQAIMKDRIELPARS